MTPPASPATHNVGHHAQWPAERFYWGVLDAKHLGRNNRRQQLGFLFENIIPGTAIEEVQSTYCRIDQDTYIACGVPSAEFASAELADAVTLSPSTLPRFIQERLGAQELSDRINLLTGPFTPKRLRSLHRAWILSVAVSLWLCAAVIVLGMERRVAAIRHQLKAVEDVRTELYKQAFTAQPVSSNQPNDLRLLGELRQLEQTRSPVVLSQGAANCVTVLSGLLQAWPDQVNALTESISITPEAITVRGQVPSMADAQNLADALKNLPDWRVTQPQSESRRDHVDVTLRLDRMPPKGDAS